jgi:Fe-S oxidoreductase
LNAPLEASVRTTENCRFCWMCRQVCPVGHATSRETLTPHAWALTIESVRRGQLAWNAETARVMYACADCGLCRSHCVTDQPLPDAIAGARGAIVAGGAAPPIVADIEAKLRAHANPYSADAPVPARQTGGVALFVGDAGRHLGAGAVAAATRLLAAIGTTVVPIGSGRSTGLLASSLGLRDAAERLARAVVDEVTASGAREVLVLSPGDRWTFEYVYPARLGVPWPVSVHVREITDVLALAVADGRLPLGRRDPLPACGYCDPCHSPRVARQRPAPRALLAATFGARPAAELFWREARAHPCGAVGGLEFTSPDIARQLAASRLADAEAAGITTLVTEDPACVAHLAAQGHAGIELVNLYELAAAALIDG